MAKKTSIRAKVKSKVKKVESKVRKSLLVFLPGFGMVTKDFATKHKAKKKKK